jgi:CHAD domain-containing protein
MTDTITNTLLTQYDVDVDHARHVADLSLAIFDALKPLHKLDTSWRQMLETGALLHNVGLHIDEPQHHIIGRDIVLDTAVPWPDQTQRAIIACLVAFHRKKVRPAQEPAYLALRKRDQQAVLHLAAILRIADGLDYSQSQTTTLQAGTVGDDAILLTIRGPLAAADGARAEKKADLARQVFKRTFQIEVVAAESVPTASASHSNGVAHASQQDTAGAKGEKGEPTVSVESVASRNPIEPTDTLADGGRRVLRQTYQKLLAAERDLFEGDPIEGVHQMRVNTRRLRAVLQLLADIGPQKRIRGFRRDLRNLARALGPVRDSDVFLIHVDAFIAENPDERRAGMQVLHDALQRDRASGGKAMNKYLASDEYADFKRRFAAFTVDDGKGWDTTLRIRDRVGSTIWQRYEELRAHETSIDLSEGVTAASEEALHEARITGKRLRYVLETFSEVLDSPTVDDRCLKPLKVLQDHLGELQDMAVARAYIEALDIPHADYPMLEYYLTVREESRAKLLKELPQRWERLMGETYRRDLARLLVRL